MPANRNGDSVRVRLAGACSPLIGARQARVATLNTRLMAWAPRPLVIAVVSQSQQPAPHTVTALMGQVLCGLAPDRVAILDADGIGQALRSRLGADQSGDLRAMLTSAHARRTRRGLELFLAAGASVPLLTAAGDDRTAHLEAGDVQAALAIVQRRFPIVLLNLPSGVPVATARWAVEAADHVVLLAPASSAVGAAIGWVRELTDPAAITTASSRTNEAATSTANQGVTADLPNLPVELVSDSDTPVRADELPTPALIALLDLTSRALRVAEQHTTSRRSTLPR